MPFAPRLGHGSDRINVETATALFHAFLRIPISVHLADVDDLAGVIRVMRADSRDVLRPLGKLRVVSFQNRFFPGR